MLGGGADNAVEGVAESICRLLRPDWGLDVLFIPPLAASEAKHFDGDDIVRHNDAALCRAGPLCNRHRR